MLDDLMPLVTDYAVRIGGALILLFVAFRVAAAAQRAVESGLGKQRFDATLTRFFGSIARWLVLVVAVLACLGIFGIETTSVAAVLGAASLAVGLAFQGTLSSFASGVMLLVFRPFTIGDLVIVGGTEGIVQELGLFSTAIDTLDHRRIILPNSAIFGATIENQTFHDKRRVDVPVGADYGAGLDETREALLAAAERCPGRRQDLPVDAYLCDLGGSSVDWSVRVWCDPAEYLGVRQNLVRETKLALDAAGIGIPYPQMDVHLDGGLSS